VSSSTVRRFEPEGDEAVGHPVHVDIECAVADAADRPVRAVVDDRGTVRVADGRRSERIHGVSER
jgi:hypothetical protein